MGTDLHQVHVERLHVSAKTKKQQARNPRSLRSERFRLLRSLREGVTTMTEAEVSGSLSLVGVSGGREGNVVGETWESGGREGTVVGETWESGGREGTVVGETGLIEGSIPRSWCHGV